MLCTRSQTVKKMDYSNACRLCLSKGGQQLPIFESTGNDLELLSTRILSCLSIQVSEIDDGLPKQVCHRCECQVNVLHYFKAQCELSQRELERWQETLRRPFLVPSEFEAAGSEHVDSEDVKLEPEDAELYAEHHHCDDTDGSQHSGDDAPANLPHQHIHREDDASSSCNLVISETVSVAIENVPGVSLECGDVSDASVDKQITHDFKKTDSVSLSKLGTNPTFNGVSVLRSISGGGIVEKFSSAPNALPDKLYNDVSPDFMELEDSKNSGGVPSIEDPLADSKDEEMKCFEEILVKEEEADSEDAFPSHPLDFSDVRSNSSATLLASTVTQVEPPNGNDNPTKYFPLNSYYHVDLPKLNNRMIDEKAKYCKICQKSFANSNLWRHMKACHAKENPFQCMACEKIFPGRRELVSHMIRTLKKDCRAGKKSEQDMSLVTTYKNVQYGVKGRYQCNICKAKFSKLDYVMAHVRLHTGEKPFFCFKCNRDFRLQKTAANHVSSCNKKDCHHPALAKEAVKPVSSSIKVSQILKRKAVKPMNSKDKLRKCTVCSKSFKSPVGFSNHLRGGCARKCFSCLELVSQNSFFKHYRQCLKSQNVQTTGIVASEKQTDNQEDNGDEDAIKDHGKDTKDAKKRATGPITEIVDATVQELIAKHTDSQGKRLLTCQLCQRTMANKSTLYRHLIMHSSISVLKCELCNVRMSMPSVYKAHMLKFHSGSQVAGVGNSDESQSVSIGNKTESSKSKPKFSGFQVSKLKCDICLKLCSSASSLKFHKQTHRKVKCSRCEITFPASMEKSHVCNPKIKTEVLLSNQDHLSHPEASKFPSEKIPSQYTCQLCKKKFHTKKMLYQHKKMHIKVKIYKCKVCGNSYSDAGALLEHKVAAHANEDPLPSSAVNCDKSYLQASEGTSVLSSDGQMEEKTVEKPWKCSVCCRGFINKKSYKRHLKLHGLTKINTITNKKLQELFTCSICDKAFRSQDSYNAHKGWHSRQQNHVESPTKVDKVETFPSLGLTIDVSSKNMKSPSSSQETFVCNLCSRAFFSMKSLRIHVTVNHKKSKPVPVTENKADHPVSSELVKCDTCHLSFADVHALSSHLSSHPKNSPSSSTTPTEVYSEISKQEPLQCKLCKKEYRCKKSLKYHLMGHSGEKPYKCRSCSNQYSNPKALSKHEKERHTTVLRPFSCNRCKLSFILKEDLLAHHEKCLL